MTERDRDSHEHDFGLDDPLGIAQEPVPASSVDHTGAEDDPATRRRRRARAGLDGHQHDGDHPDTTGDSSNRDGATGIDMGYGGSGTNVKP